MKICIGARWIASMARGLVIAAVAGAGVMIVGCKDLSGSVPLPSGATDPSLYTTSDGIVQQTDGVRGLFRSALNRFVIATGTLTDELSDETSLNLRNLPESTTDETDATGAYAVIQNTRVQADLVTHGIAKYAPTLANGARAEMFAIQGYTEIMLADLFCSGVPLTTLELEGDIRYQAGSPTDSMYTHAIALFDSAQSIGGDSGVMTLARVGKGRALLMLGQFDKAAQAVAPVHDGDAYQLFVVLGANNGLDGLVSPLDFRPENTVDREGVNGLPFQSSGDLRTQSIVTNISIDTIVYAPGKYVQGLPVKGDSVAFVVADWVEARLIEAEVALHDNNAETWRITLNHLRTTASVPGNGTLLDTIADPGTASARVDTMFSDRAAWLYLTGHRQSDLRRLVRWYGRASSALYPIGLAKRGNSYGVSIDAPVPASERRNDKFRGCLSRG